MTRTEELRRRAVDRTTAPQGDEGTAREILAATLHEDPFERIEELRQAGKRKAEAEGLAYRMEHERKGILARLATEYARTHSKQNLSEAKLDRLAHADPRYQQHVEGTAAAVEKRELANSEYWALRSRLEWLRASLAHLNALSRLEGYE